MTGRFQQRRPASDWQPYQPITAMLEGGKGPREGAWAAPCTAGSISTKARPSRSRNPTSSQKRAEEEPAERGRAQHAWHSRCPASTVENKPGVRGQLKWTRMFKSAEKVMKRYYRFQLHSTSKSLTGQAQAHNPSTMEVEAGGSLKPKFETRKKHSETLVSTKKF